MSNAEHTIARFCRPWSPQPGTRPGRDRPQRTVSAADHTALLHNEAMSANSSQAIRDVVSAIRTGTPLKA